MASRQCFKVRRRRVNKIEALSILYVAPGNNLLNEAGPTRNVLSVANALSQWSQVTVAFRKILGSLENYPFKVIEIDPSCRTADEPVDDSAIRGSNLSDFISYLRRLKRFARATASQYDVILEKSWTLSGYLVAVYQKQGVPGVLVENMVRVWNEPINSFHSLICFWRYKTAQFLIGRYLKTVPAVIAETEALKKAILRRWQVNAQKISVVDLGVDHQLFRPMDQNLARQELRMSRDSLIMLYAGVMDKCHDLAPVIEAMNRKSPTNLELHLVGNGRLFAVYKKMAAKLSAKVFFHGYVPHKMVPIYLTAADICLAPYNLASFPEAEVSYSILKIHEYLACGRPVISVPSSQLLEMIQPDVTGFIVANNSASWEKLFQQFPTRSELRSMARNVSKRYRHHGWEQTAEKYIDVCRKLLNPHTMGVWWAFIISVSPCISWL